MKKKLLGGLALALLLAGCGNSGDSDKEKTDDGKKTYKIGIIQQMEHPALDSAREGLEKYLKGKSDAKFEITVKNAQGDNGTADTIAKQFVSDDVDLIYSIATNASQAAVNATGGTDIPVVFNAVTDGVEAKLVTSNEKPGGNVTGVSDAAPLEKQLEMIREFLPEAKKIGMIYNIGEVNGKLQVKQVEKLASKYNFEIVKKGVSATTEIATAAEQLAGDVDCIYNITDNMVVSATASITDKANAKNIPVFAAEDGQMKAGLLASDSISYEKLGEQAGSVAYDILVNGKKAGDIPVETAKDTTLYINKKVAEQLGIKIPDSLAERATFVEE
ncbi:ABC transporter substrate-binding protein [[Clostridium] innocuum]|uniref:ABC transporter substrate-binding protein n=1 Tax=Clostridium innocuum TaxID=1522 RepID=A0A099I1D4_CLOIN|nr:ABC transporter substrate-binding protein [[Clostridium] innocuum]KGJ51515.1 ABC transporter substrate-binding protein [[Clostridium] innocuum]MCR0159942.1 ABC transporter substrate-binding protein [[Clostridium] innocuum]MCR0485769.1 ABC transporter substrate-binding protein [[Clostridium] innocuum]